MRAGEQLDPANLVITVSAIAQGKMLAPPGTAPMIIMIDGAEVEIHAVETADRIRRSPRPGRRWPGRASAEQILERVQRQVAADRERREAERDVYRSLVSAPRRQSGPPSEWKDGQARYTKRWSDFECGFR